MKFPFPDGDALERDQRREDPLVYYLVGGTWERVLGFEFSPEYEYEWVPEVIGRIYSGHIKRLNEFDDALLKKVIERFVETMSDRNRHWTSWTAEWPTTLVTRLGEEALEAPFLAAGWTLTKPAKYGAYVWLRAGANREKSATHTADRTALKNATKQQIEERSRELEQKILEANPAPIGSDEWAASYRTALDREHALKAAPPDRMSEADATEKFVLQPTYKRHECADLWYAQCAHCRDLIHTKPSARTTCSCGAVQIWVTDTYGHLQGHYKEGDILQIVKLMGRG